jgi:hypothetical protein
MKGEPGCQNDKKGSKKKLCNKFRVLIEKNENFFFKKVPDGSRCVIFCH